MPSATKENPVQHAKTTQAPVPAAPVKESAEAGSMVYVNLLTDVYIDDELNAREETAPTPEEVQALAASIEESNGLLQPIGIHATPKIRKTEHQFPYELVYGFRRSAALKFLAEQNQEPQWVERVPAMVKEESTTTRMAADQLVENLVRKDMSKMEVARKFRSMIDADPVVCTNKALSRMTGWDTATISNYVRMTNLDPSVQDLISSGKLTWSNGREIERLDLPVEEQKQWAATGTADDMTPEKFLKKLKATFPEKYKDEDKKEGETAETTGATGIQKAEQSLRAAVVKDKYLTHFEKQMAEAKDAKAKEKWQIRADTLKFVLKQQGTAVGTELAPWEQQLEKEAEAKEVADKEGRAKKAYIRKAITAVETELKTIPPAFLEDGKTPNPKREMPTLPKALATVKASVVADIEAGKKDGLPKDHVKSGEASFAVTNVDTLMEEIGKAHGEHLENKKRDQVEREKRKAEEKAKTDAEAKQTEAPVTA